jgi:cytochrome oxidase assembly protein ShyY1
LVARAEHPRPAGYREAVFRALLTGRMLAGLALAIAFAVVCVLLGRWQWGRYEDKVTRAAAITTHYTAAPVPLVSMLGRLPLAESDEWTRVSTTGRYAVQQQLLVRNRALSGAGGLEVLVPLDLDGDAGGRLLVDRGWVANPASAADLPAVPPAPAGTVTVQGWLRHGEVDLGKGLPEGQLASITVADARAQVGGALLDTYLVLESEQTPSGVVPARPTPLEQPDTGLGPHQAYAYQWWLTSTFGFVLLGHRLRVAHATRHAVGDTESTDVVGTPRVRKVRIWDEEDA